MTKVYSYVEPLIQSFLLKNCFFYNLLFSLRQLYELNNELKLGKNHKLKRQKSLILRTTKQHILSTFSTTYFSGNIDTLKDILNNRKHQMSRSSLKFKQWLTFYGLFYSRKHCVHN